MTIEELKALFETGKEITQEMFETLIDELQGKDGANGKSAYEVALEGGFEGTVQEWLESLKGADGGKGEQGEEGEQGKPGQDGKDGFGTEEQYNALVGRIESLESKLEEPEEPED